MQKTLTQMNVELANVISDISGVTGMVILHAIAAGERDPVRLSTRKHNRVRASRREPHEAWKATGARNCCSCWNKGLSFTISTFSRLRCPINESSSI
jgi:hypothetical protein